MLLFIVIMNYTFCTHVHLKIINSLVKFIILGKIINTLL